MGKGVNRAPEEKGNRRALVGRQAKKTESAALGVQAPVATSTAASRQRKKSARAAPKEQIWITGRTRGFGRGVENEKGGREDLCKESIHE